MQIRTNATARPAATADATGVSYPVRIGPSATVSMVIRAPIGEVFAHTVAEDVLPKVLHRFGPVPAVVGTKVLHGPWERVGADRRVKLEGGGRLHEQITGFARPTGFTYQIDQFEGTVLSAVAKRAAGSWRLTDLGGGSTRVEWTYSFEPKNKLAKPALEVFAKTIYRGYMRQALRLLAADVKADPKHL